MAGLVRLRGVTKRFRSGDWSWVTAADDVTLEFPAGSRTALMGPSGSGKSTLLHLMGAIDVPDSGTIEVDGEVITSLSRRAASNYRARVGFVFQQFHLLPALSLLDNVLAPLMGRSFSGDRRVRAMELLDAVGLADRAKDRPGHLSGGQQQRVAIARALVASPVLLLADEPTGNLDSATALDVMALLTSLQAEYGATMVIATHDVMVAQACEDQIQIRDGRVAVASRDGA